MAKRKYLFTHDIISLLRHEGNDLHCLTFRWDAHGLPRHPTQAPVGAHGILRGRPWASMVSCGIPRAPTQGVVGSHASCRATEHGLPRGNPRLKGLKKLHMRYILRLTMFGHPAWAPTWVPTRAPMWAPMGSHVGSHGVPRGVPRGIPCRCCHGNTRESPRDYKRYIPRR